jgi:hypothetical protein
MLAVTIADPSPAVPPLVFSDVSCSDGGDDEIRILDPLEPGKEIAVSLLALLREFNLLLAAMAGRSTAECTLAGAVKH